MRFYSYEEICKNVIEKLQNIHYIILFQKGQLVSSQIYQLKNKNKIYNIYRIILKLSQIFPPNLTIYSFIQTILLSTTIHSNLFNFFFSKSFPQPNKTLIEFIIIV